MLDGSSKALPSTVLIAPSQAEVTWFLPCRRAGAGVAGGHGSSVPRFLGGLSCSVVFLSLYATLGCVAMGALGCSQLMWQRRCCGRYSYSVGFRSLMFTWWSSATTLIESPTPPCPPVRGVLSAVAKRCRSLCGHAGCPSP